MELLKAGVLRPSGSPWSSPMVPVKKSDGRIRLCIDYRRFNAITELDPYEILWIRDLLDQVGDAAFLTKLDLNKQVQMAANMSLRLHFVPQFV